MPEFLIDRNLTDGKERVLVAVGEMGKSLDPQEWYTKIVGLSDTLAVQIVDISDSEEKAGQKDALLGKYASVIREVTFLHGHHDHTASILRMEDMKNG